MNLKVQPSRLQLSASPRLDPRERLRLLHNQLTLSRKPLHLPPMSGGAARSLTTPNLSQSGNRRLSRPRPHSLPQTRLPQLRPRLCRIEICPMNRSPAVPIFVAIPDFSL